MDQPPPIVESPPPAAPKEPTMSLAARLLNVVAVPGDVFEEVKVAPASVANWFVPILLACVVGAVAAFILFSQPAIQQRIHEQQQRALEQKVKAGKMTQAQADQAMGVVEKFSGPGMLKIFGAAGAVFSSFVRVFFWAAMLWLLGRWVLKVKVPYLKTVEVVGLASVIWILGAIVTLLLQVNFSNPSSSPSLALAVHEFDPAKPGHLLLAAVNLFDLWGVGVMACGLGRLAGVPFARAGFAVLGFWMIWLILQSALGVALGQMAG